MLLRKSLLGLIATGAISLLTACGGGAATESVSEPSSASPTAPTTTTPPGATTNRAPVISGSAPTTVVVGAAYLFQPTASDPEGNTLTFAIQNKPSWAAFDTSTGRLSGTPAAGNVGTSAAISISVSDGANTVALPAFSIVVSAASTGTNRAPTIAGTPAGTAQVGAAYSFQPSATDPEAQPLTYSISNKPGWLSFSTSTGRLTGTPSSGDVGSFGSIVISVSDGQNTVSLAPFSITVSAAPIRSATINWTAPTQRQDGSTLANLAGYKIYYGRASDSLAQVVTISNPGLLTAVIDNLTTGTWYFAVKSFDAAGVESNLSNPVNVAL